MPIMARPKPIAFGSGHRDAKAQLDAWWAEARRAQWRKPTDIKAQYRNASILKGGRVVFDICGNEYRPIMRFGYGKGIGFVRFLGTREEYDQIDAEEV